MKIEEAIPHLRNNEAVEIRFGKSDKGDELWMNTRVWSGPIHELLEMEFRLRPKDWLSLLPHEEDPVLMIQTLEKTRCSEFKLKAL